MPRNAMTLGRAVYNALIPTNMRVFGETLLGRKNPVTEQDLTPAEQEMLFRMYQTKLGENAVRESQYISQAARSPQDYAARPETDLVERNGEFRRETLPYEQSQQRAAAKAASFANTRGKTSLSYLDYPSAENAPVQDPWYNILARSLTDPEYNLKTTLGSFNVLDTPEGPVINDVYNFDNADYYSRMYGINPYMASNRTLANSAKGLMDFADLYLIKNRPNMAREVKVRLNGK